MKVNITPTAQDKIAAINDIDTIENGFLLGYRLGRHVIIEDLFPVNFNRDNIDRLYAGVYEKFGERLLGQFFCDETLFFNEWFGEDIILKIGRRSRKTLFYHYDYENGYIQLPVAPEKDQK